MKFNAKELRQAIMPMLCDVVIITSNEVICRKFDEVVTKINGEGEGRVCVGALMAFKALEFIDDVDISIDGNSVLFTHLNGVMRLPTMPEPLEINHPTPTFYLKGDFSRIGKVRGVVKEDDFKPAMSGICLDAIGGKCAIVGTDASSLYIEEVECEGEGQIVLPRNAWGLVGECSIGGGKMLHIINEHMEAWINSIDKAYPNYKAILNNAHTVFAEVKRKELIRTMKQAAGFSIFAKLIVNDCLTVSASNIDFGNDFTARVAGRMAGIGETGLNCLRVVGALYSEEGEYVKISIGETGRAVLIGNRIVMPANI